MIEYTEILKESTNELFKIICDYSKITTHEADIVKRNLLNFQQKVNF